MIKSPSLLIAGAGPVGLSLALALSRRGIAVRVREAQSGLGSEARASTWHPPTLEMLREWGVADAIIARGFQVDRLQYWERETRTRVAEFNYARIAGDTPFPFRLQCPQSAVTPILLDALRATGLADVRFDHSLTGFETGPDGVVATFDTPAGPRAETSDYLVGADGARSAVRKGLGLSFEGATYTDRFLLIATRFDFTPIFPGMGPVSYIFDPHEWVILMRLPEVVRVVFRLAEDEDEAVALTDNAIQNRFAHLIGIQTGPVPILQRSTYTVHRRVADTFRHGRVVLAGDAAHVNNPTGGMGMNSGIHDAHALATAFGAIAEGGDPDAALDAYATERRRVALELVQQVTDQSSRWMNARDLNERLERNAVLRAEAADPVRHRAHLLRAAMLDARI
jgi:3-(3-hydroxy-phenyl)propionate hydroxylase